MNYHLCAVDEEASGVILNPKEMEALRDALSISLDGAYKRADIQRFEEVIKLVDEIYPKGRG